MGSEISGTVHVGAGIAKPSAVYGNPLLSFPELWRDFVFFDADPKLNDGYGKRQNETQGWGVIQTATSRVKDSNNKLVVTSQYRLWTDSKIKMGRFIDFEGVVYRNMTDADWPTEGGYYEYTIDKLVGSSPGEKATPVDEWNKATGNLQ